jgi:hypothetical protein
MTRTDESTLRHRPFATLLRPSTDDATITAGTIRAEIRALVARGALNRRDGTDLLARLGLQVLPNRYAVQAGVGQVVAALGRLRAGYLTQPAAITVPTDQPAHRSLTGLTHRRTEACLGYPVGGIYQISADARPATMVSADSAAAAYAAATARLAAELAQLDGIDADVQRMRHLGAHRFTGLDDPPTDTSAGPPDPGVAAPACRAARRDPR